MDDSVIRPFVQQCSFKPPSSQLHATLQTSTSTNVIKPPKDVKPPGKKGGFFYVYFFGSYQYAFVGSKHIFQFSIYYKACFDTTIINPKYIAGVKKSVEIVHYLETQRGQVGRLFFNGFHDAAGHVHFFRNYRRCIKKQVSKKKPKKRKWEKSHQA
ncbi:hypothetical protein TNCV_1768791 [Trichonephila clavipes]|nr:hypothetical protein TNCV_1768791 [Trichonephila clavipes]